MSKLLKMFRGLSRVKKALVLLVIAGAGWWGYKAWAAGRAAEPLYQTGQVEKGTLVVTVSGSGTVTTANNASVTTTAGGVVSRVLVKNGDTVRAGAALTVLDPDQSSRQAYMQASAAYQSAKNSLESAKSRLYSLNSAMFAANQKLINDAVARNLAPDDPTYIQQNSDWKAAEADYLNGQNSITQAQTSLSSAYLSMLKSSPTIYAPIPGTVTGLSLLPGMGIAGSSTGQKIANIVTKAPITVTLSLTEVDAGKVTSTDKATVTFDALPDKTYTGKVISVDTVGAVSSGVTTYPTVIALDGEGLGILPNMAASASIITEIKSDVLIVPVSAVTTQNGQSAVQVMKNGQVQEVTVETGLASDTQIEIVSGLSEGDAVVTATVARNTNSGGQTQTPSVFGGFGGGNRNFGGGGGAVRITR